MLGFGLAFLAGILTIVSPCVLPLVPLVLGAAASEHRWGPAALALGLALSFVALGIFVATIGFAIGLDGEIFRKIAAVLLILLGLVLVIPVAQVRLATAAGPVGNWTEQRFGGFATTGLWGQFCVGLLLGAVWSPCVGPTLGAASMLAAQGRDLPAVAAVMAAFGLGTAVPLLIVGSLSRAALLHWRGRMTVAGQAGKILLGGGALAVSALVLTGADRALEAALVAASPAWLTDLTARF